MNGMALFQTAVLGEKQRICFSLGVSTASGTVEQADNSMASLSTGDHFVVEVTAFGISEDLGLTVRVALGR